MSLIRRNIVKNGQEHSNTVVEESTIRIRLATQLRIYLSRVCVCSLRNRIPHLYANLSRVEQFV